MAIFQSAEYNYTHISTNTTTTIFTPQTGNQASYALLHSVSINSKGASSNTVTIYDNTAGSGTVIAIIDGTSAQTTLFFDVRCYTGLTIVTATGTPADITVSWRKGLAE